MQRMARPPSPESVQAALEWAKNKPGSAVRILTMDNAAQRVVVLHDGPAYYDVELGKDSPIGRYHLLGKGRVVSSAPYNENAYRKSLCAFGDYEVLASGGRVIKDDTG